MAALERRNDTYRVIFMSAGRKYSYSLDTYDKSTTEALRGGVEKTLMLLGQGLTKIPDGGDVVAFGRYPGGNSEAGCGIASDLWAIPGSVSRGTVKRHD